MTMPARRVLIGGKAEAVARNLNPFIRGCVLRSSAFDGRPYRLFLFLGEDAIVVIAPRMALPPPPVVAE